MTKAKVNDDVDVDVATLSDVIVVAVVVVVVVVESRIKSLFLLAMPTRLFSLSNSTKNVIKNALPNDQMPLLSPNYFERFRGEKRVFL